MNETKYATETGTTTSKPADPQPKATPTVAEEVAKEKGFVAWAASSEQDFKTYGAQYLFGGFGYGKGLTERQNLVKLAALALARIEKLDSPKAATRSGC